MSSRRFWPALLFTLLGAVVVPGCGGASKGGGGTGGSGNAGGSCGQACTVTCTYDGRVHDPGETFPASDGCNTCSCSEDGSVACTKKACFDCQGISEQYGAAYDQGKACDPEKPNQCTLLIVAGLQCSCETFVNRDAWDADAIESLARQYNAGSCGGDVLCGQCLAPVRGSCSPEGRCVDEDTPIEGPGCKVGDVVYPSGTDHIPDPVSCNECVCNAGQLSCTEKNCPKPCPADTKLGTGCAACGPVDNCLIVETGCFPICTSTCAVGVCVDGTCHSVCG